jgi:hypothetical protein
MTPVALCRPELSFLTSLLSADAEVEQHRHDEHDGGVAQVEEEPHRQRPRAVLDQHRITTARRVLVSVLSENRAHRSADELAAAVQARLPGTNRSTIYRNLDGAGN